MAKLKKDDKDALVCTIERKVSGLMSTEESPLQVTLQATLGDIGSTKDYYMDREGEVYLKVV